MKDNSVISLSKDHKPDTPNEKPRIEGAGLFVKDNRINGVGLSMSRALGDY